MSRTAGEWKGLCRDRDDAYLVVSGPLGGPDTVAVATIHNVSKEDASVMIAGPVMLAALKAQHEAIDRLFALLLLVTRKPEEAEEFFPSKSGQPWEAAMMGNAAIALAEGTK